MTVVAILTAAGSGQRLGSPLPKALVPLGGLSLVVHAARALVGAGTTSETMPGGPRAAGPVDLVIVTVPASHRSAFVAALGPDVRGVPVVIVDGGATRQASVAAALALVPPDAEVVLVHDAARALVPTALVHRVVAAVRAGHEAVIPGLAVSDTIKRVGPDGLVVATLVRDELRAVQTPQGFAHAVLARAHAAGAHRAADESSAASDDAGLVESLGLAVLVVDGHEDAAKITTPRDLALAELVLAARATRTAPTSST